jgi:hypothetical protein
MKSILTIRTILLVLTMAWGITCFGQYTTQINEGYLTEAPNGNDLWVRVISPNPDLYPGQTFPCVVYVPDSLAAGGNRSALIAQEGYVEIRYNPEGRGTAHPSQGSENYHGTNHQDDLKAIVDYAHGLDQVIDNDVMVAAYGDGMAEAAGCLARYPLLEVKCLIDVEGSSGSYTTLADPWLLDGNPTNDRTAGYYALYHHYSTVMDTSSTNRTWWSTREALPFMGSIHCRYLRLQAQWDGRQPPNQTWQGFYYPPNWYPGKHAVDLSNGACAGSTPWVRVNLSDLGNPVGQLYDSLSPPAFYSGRMDTSHVKAAIREMSAMPPISPAPPAMTWIVDRDGGAELWWDNDTLFAIDHWEVYRALWNTPNPLTLVASPTDTFFDDISLENGLTYWYRVKAVSSTGHISDYSNICYARPHPADVFLPMVMMEVARLDNGNTLITDGGFIGPGWSGGVFEITPAGECVWSVQRTIRWAHNGDLLPGHHVIISDTKNNRVIVMDSLENILWNTDDIPFSDGSVLNYPNDANMIEGGNNRLITDRDNHRVFEVDAVGNVVWQFGVTGVLGNDNTHINGPHNGDRLSNGNTIFTDSNNNRVLEVNQAGQIVWQYATGLAWPRDADRLENGNTLIVDTNHNRIIEVTSSGNVVWQFSQGVQIPYDADRLPNGNTLISTRTKVLEVTPAGVVVWQYPPSGLPAPEDVTISVVGSDIQLAWKMVVNATKYYIYSDDEPITSIIGLTRLANSTVTHIVLSGVAPNYAKRFFVVTSWNSQ